MKDKYILILSIDPSGNFKNGKGRTGIAIGQADVERKQIKRLRTKTIDAKEFLNQQDYWDQVVFQIDLVLFQMRESFNDLGQGYSKEDFYCIIEDFRLHKTKAIAQSGSEMETSQLIALLKNKCDKLNVKYYMQNVGIVKPAMQNKHLIQDKIITKQKKSYYLGTKRLSKHELDAIRHLNWFIWCNTKDKLRPKRL